MCYSIAYVGGTSPIVEEMANSLNMAKAEDA